MEMISFPIMGSITKVKYLPKSYHRQMTHLGLEPEFLVLCSMVFFSVWYQSAGLESAVGFINVLSAWDGTHVSIWVLN